MASENPFSVLDLTYAIIETYPPSIRFPYSYPSVTSELIGPVRAISRLCCTPNMWPTYFTRLVKDRSIFHRDVSTNLMRDDDLGQAVLGHPSKSISTPESVHVCDTACISRL